MKKKIINIILALTMLIFSALIVVGCFDTTTPIQQQPPTDSSTTNGGNITVTNLNLTQLPNRMLGFVGEAPDLTGGILEATYSDGTIKAIYMTDERISVFPEVLLTASVDPAFNTIILSYGGQIADFSLSEVIEMQEGLTLTFSDEFAHPEINRNNWSFQLGTGSQGPSNPWGNQELQFYREENASIRDGQLVINARRENVIFIWRGGGNSEEIYVTDTPLDEIDFANTPALVAAGITGPSDITILPSGTSRPPNVVGRAYMSEFTSSRMRTSDNFSQMFGRFEAKISLPTFTGAWPAFWMMPERNTLTGGGWPRNGEIDIMEARGRNPYTVAQTVHIGVGSHARHRWLGRAPDYQLSVPGQGGRTIRDFIIYRIDWHPDRISWYVDDVHVFTLRDTTWRNPPGGGSGNLSAGWGGVWYNAAVVGPNLDPHLNTAYRQRPDRPSAPFDHPFHMILNLAIGGVYDGHLRPPVDFLSDYMKIDWVRTWQFDEYLDWYFCFDTMTPIMDNNG
ncbi:MAG: glycoside hydrolase family 16 protein [Firmicutes bacterium]|nr:glycoside hydrolase family 16 protein [Bacillota bacterium]